MGRPTRPPEGKARARQQLARAPDIARMRATAPVRLLRARGLVDYEDARARMRRLSERIAAGTAPEHLWLLEHPPLLTAGTSARASDLLQPGRLPVHAVGRGGRFTYHGPGQRIAYVMLNLRHRGRDVRLFITALEQWIIDTLAELDVSAFRAEERVGVWTRLPDGREAKIAAIGVRVSRGITRHGIALNVDPDLSHYEAIVPCGLAGHAITSLHALGVPVSMQAVDALLIERFEKIFDHISNK